MEKTYTYEQLVEKIVRAKIKLEGQQRGHSDSCPVEADPEGFAPCNCGASSHNRKINNAIEELDL